MSQLGASVPPSRNLSESLSVSNLTVLVLLLFPCVLLVLLLNCLLFGYKFLLLARKKRQRTSSDESILLQSTRQRVTRFSDGPSFSNQNRKINYVSVSEPMLALPVTSSLTSSAERAAAGLQRCRSLRPDVATCGGSGSLRAPSTLLAAISTTGSTASAGLPEWRISAPVCVSMSKGETGCRRSAPVLPQSSDSETERANTVPPNSPEFHATLSGGFVHVRPLRLNSTMDQQRERTSVTSLDRLHVECEFGSSIPPEGSGFGTGLDSDFGASAGVSLRILSADSDGLAGASWATGLEWDYYDPSYVTQNHVPKQRQHPPPVTAQQYWV